MYSNFYKIILSLFFVSTYLLNCYATTIWSDIDHADPDSTFPIYREVFYCSQQKAFPIHITFDDGPHPIYTEKILETLKKNNIQATFLLTLNHFSFLQNLENNLTLSPKEQAQLSLIQRMIHDGHQIGNHSYLHIDHSNFQEKETVLNNINQANDLFQKLNLKKPAPFRFPYGANWFLVKDQNQLMFNEMIKNYILDLNYYLFHWDLDSWDWSETKRKRLPLSLLKQICTQEGGVILAHDIQRFTADNLQTLIDSILASGHYFLNHKEIINYNKSLNKNSLSKNTVGISYCDKPKSFIDQIWSSCELFNTQSADYIFSDN